MKGVFCVGGAGAQGTYVLRIAIKSPVDVALGRFRGGRLFHFPAGEYLYVGSARGLRGSATLARRLLRHATRAQGAPHSLRPALQAFFGQEPPAAKSLRWHVDYLLEVPQADLQAVFLLRRPLPLEGALSRFLLQDPRVTAFPRGAGASDDPGGAHLLRVEAAPAWWSDFPARLGLWLRAAS